jgi:catechol 2,3-dioxygenase-like lactoylglutathione lyase family enzyme
MSKAASPPDGPPDAAARPARVRVECILPILNVADVAASLGFYVGVLGFDLDWRVGPMASVSRNGGAIMLCQAGLGQARGCGSAFRQEPTNHPRSFEVQVEDPDGHVLRIGADPQHEPPAT